VTKTSDQLAEQLRIASEVISERDRQDFQWGGPDQDDRRSSRDFLSYIASQVELATAEKTSGHRNRMLRIAALAVASIEAIDRREHAEQAAQLGALSPAVNAAAIEAGLARRITAHIVTWRASTDPQWWSALARFARILPRHVETQSNALTSTAIEPQQSVREA
jgi:hypothetical protein